MTDPLVLRGFDRNSPGAQFRRSLFRRNSLLIGAVIFGTIVLVALAAPLLAPFDPYVQDLSRRLKPPYLYSGYDPAHVLGTDPYGRDYLSRLFYGGRVSLLVGGIVTLIAGLVGITIGLLAGYFGNRVDLSMMFVINMRLALPIFLVALAAVVVFGSSLLNLVLTLGLLLWDRFALVSRSLTQRLRQTDYVLAAKAIGCSTTHILIREILPNIAGPLAVIATIEMANAILLEAAHSFLGLGIQEPTASWGLMLSQARRFMFFDTWLLAIPGLALFSLVLAINLIGDGLSAREGL